MIRESVTIQDVLDYLNAMLEIDPGLMGDFINNRFKLNKPDKEYPDALQLYASHGNLYVGLTGFLNGLFGKHDDEPQANYGPIMAVVDKANQYNIYGFVRTETFYEDAVSGVIRRQEDYADIRKEAAAKILKDNKSDA